MDTVPQTTVSDGSQSPVTQPTVSDGSQSPVTQTKSKYGIIQSIKDTFAGISNNPTSVVTSVVISYVLSAIVLIAILIVAAGLLFGQIRQGSASIPSLLVSLAVALVIYTILSAFVYAFTLSCLAISIGGKIGVGNVIKKAASVTIRVVQANMLVILVAFWPFLIAAILPLFLFTSSAADSVIALSLLSPLLGLAGLIWAIIAMLRFALVPMVAIFEPEISINQTLKRSQELLKNGGQWFVVKGILLIILILIIIAVVTGSNANELQSSGNMALNAFYVLVSVVIEGALVMLYFNRTKMTIPVTTNKSTSLLLITGAIMIGLVAVAGVQRPSETKYDGKLSDTEQAEMNKFLEEYQQKNN